MRIKRQMDITWICEGFVSIRQCSRDAHVPYMCPIAPYADLYSGGEAQPSSSDRHCAAARSGPSWDPYFFWGEFFHSKWVSKPKWSEGYTAISLDRSVMILRQGFIVSEKSPFSVPCDTSFSIGSFPIIIIDTACKRKKSCGARDCACASALSAPDFKHTQS